MTKKLDWRRVLCTLIACVVMFGALAANASAAAWTSAQEFGLTIHYLYEETEVVGAEFRLYKVGAVEQNGSIIILSNQFEDYPVPTDGWADTDFSELAYTLAGYVMRDGLEPYDAGVTDEFGMLYLPSEASQAYEPGLYLLIGLPVEVNGMLVTPTPTLFYLPSTLTGTDADKDPNTHPSADGKYDTIIFPKSEAVPIVPTVVPVTPGEPEPAPSVPTLTSMKLWNDAGHEAERPAEVQVQLIDAASGEVYQTVTLNAANNWSFTWSDLPAGHSWYMTELTTGTNYRVTVENRDGVYAVTNTWAAEPAPEPTPETPAAEKLPQTGTLWWVVPILAAGGLVLIVAGLLRRRTEED